jgi:hypothetical protein
VADDNTKSGQTQDQPGPNPALASLDVMVGTWDLRGRESGPDGEIHGQVTFEWMEGGFYLVQRVDIDHIGQRITGVEYVGSGGSTGTLKPYFFSNHGPGPFGGVALEYVWEVGADTITIWGGFVGSPASIEASSATTATPSPAAGNGRGRIRGDHDSGRADGTGWAS